ncbi:hypothetical protein T02_10013 [Trichinella nativa]|uniref:Uncharacterized protein n=1 Tax=Trichinella nativa TaxID=6335 RepID=A0A0V1L3S4_9BILA|nr:hypothetical protein T02_10013 [Trichinella nativa]
MSFIPALEFTQSMVTAAREKLASLTPVKLNGDPLILKEFATLLAICQMIYSYQNIQISISEWVKSNRDSLGLNQEAACNTLNSREIISVAWGVACGYLFENSKIFRNYEKFAGGVAQSIA